MPEEEHKSIAPMSKVESSKTHEAEINKKKTDFSWWNFDDPHSYLCIFTKDDSYEAGQQLLTSYGRHTNKHLLVHYGFCISDNMYDSVIIRIHRKIDSSSLLTEEAIVE